MNDLIQRITTAIFRQEGMGPDYANPGNLRSAPWRVKPVIQGGFWRPATRAEGVAGAAHCVALRIAEGQTLAQLITAWAPPIENQTSVYLANVKQWTGIQNEHQILWELLINGSVAS